jgi:hypothetical protein
VAALGGIDLGGDFVIERDAALRLPQGLGETYFTTPRPHDVTVGLLDDDTPKLRPLLTAAQSLRATPGGPAKPLLVTIKTAFALKDLRPFVEVGRAVE